MCARTCVCVCVQKQKSLLNHFPLWTLYRSVISSFTSSFVCRRLFGFLVACTWATLSFVAQRTRANQLIHLLRFRHFDCVLMRSLHFSFPLSHSFCRSLSSSQQLGSIVPAADYIMRTIKSIVYFVLLRRFLSLHSIDSLQTATFTVSQSHKSLS